MQFSLTPQTLAQMDNVPLQYTGRALDSLDRMGTADQMSLAELQNLNEHNAAMRPMLQTQQGLQNQSLEALLPGQRAQSSMSVRKNANEDLFNADTIASLTRKHGIEKMNDYAGQLSGIGSLMLGAAAQVQNAPLGGHMAAKQMFQQAGIEDKWHPEWDNLPPKQLAERLASIGNEFVTSGSKAQSALQSAQLKGDMALERQRVATEGQVRAAQIRADAMANLARMKFEFQSTHTKENIENYMTRLMRLRAGENDSQIIAQINSQLAEAQQRLENSKTQPGIAPNMQNGKATIGNKKEPVAPAGKLPDGVSQSNW